MSELNIEVEVKPSMGRAPTPVPPGSSKVTPLLPNELSLNLSVDSDDEEVAAVIAHKTKTEAMEMEMETQRQNRNKREREEGTEDDDDNFELVMSRKEKKVLKMQKVQEIYIHSKNPMPKQFALARLFKEVGIYGINKVKYLNPYKIKVEANDEAVTKQIWSCKRFIEMDWRFQRADEVNASYGIIKEVDAELTDEEILRSITCPEPALLVAAKRLQRRDSDGRWVPSEAVRLSFKGTIVPTHITVDQLRIQVDPYVLPVTQCSRCWSLGHSSRWCSAKSVVCPKCSGLHENCETQLFKCVNCKQNHMALEKQKCPVYLKEKRVREIMSEFRCTYKKALAMYVAPSNPSKFVEEKDIVPPKSPELTFTWPKIKTRKMEQEDEGNDKRMEDTEHEKKQEKAQSERKEKSYLNKKHKEEHCWWSSEVESGTSSEPVEMEPKKVRRKSKRRQEREIPFTELLGRLKDIIFMRGISFQDKMSTMLKTCMEWVVLVVVENVSEWPILKTLWELMQGNGLVS